jgi:hypothetical protein
MPTGAESAGPGEKEVAHGGRRITRRAAMVGLLTAGAGLAAWKLLWSESEPSRPTFENLPNGSSLIERDIEIDAGQEGIERWVRARIIRLGPELGIRIGDDTTYRVKNMASGKPAFELVKDVIYLKKPGEIQIEYEQGGKSAQSLMTVFFPRERYEAIARILADEPSVALEQVEYRYEIAVVVEGNAAEVLRFEKESAGHQAA